jgi:hypothetical protein
MRLTLLAAMLLALLAAPAHAKTEIAAGGAVSATLSYDNDPDGDFDRNLRLSIVRAGQPAHDARVYLSECGDSHCPQPWPGAIAGKRSLQVTDLDADGEPEVLVSLYTGGAHCCWVAQVFRLTPGGYVFAENWFGDASYDIVGGDFVTGDARFAYAFTAYAFSRFPVQVMRYRQGIFSDVTKEFPARIRTDLRRNRKLTAKALKAGQDARGAIAAYVADAHLLGQGPNALKWAADRVDRPAFHRKLKRLLSRWGYR